MESVLACDSKSVVVNFRRRLCSLVVSLSVYAAGCFRGGGRAAPRTANETIYFVCQLELLQRFRNRCRLNQGAPKETTPRAHSQTTVIAKPL
jgi:hypothetical protein